MNEMAGSEFDHGGNLFPAEWKILFRGVSSLFEMDLGRVGWESESFAQVTNFAIHEENDRVAKPFRQIEAFDREIETLLNRAGRQSDHFMIPVRSPSRLHDVTLSWFGRLTSGWAGSLNIDNDARGFRHDRIANVLLHEGEPGARCGGHTSSARPDRSDDGC